MHSLTILWTSLTLAFAAEQDAIQKPMVSVPKYGNCSYSSYTALGDSFSGGLGAGKELTLCKDGIDTGTAECTLKNCAKYDGAYGYRLAGEMGLTTTFRYLACNGASVGDVQKDQARDGYFGNDVDLVTLTAGGDEGVGQGFFQKVADACINPLDYNSDKCDTEIYNATKLVKDELPQRLTDLLGKIISLGAKRVVVLSYIRFFNVEGASGLTCWAIIRTKQSQRKAMNDLVVLLNDQLHAAVLEFSAKHWVYWVDLDSKFDGHRICDGDEPQLWFQLDYDSIANDPKSVLHPTSDGQGAYLEAVKETISKDCFQD